MAVPKSEIQVLDEKRDADVWLVCPGKDVTGASRIADGESVVCPDGRKLDNCLEKRWQMT